MNQWSVFGVDITPKFTDDNKNVLIVTSKKEIFFDVYECTYNDKNIIVEKVGTSDGLPVVSFEAVKNNKKYKCEALLVESEKSELLLNENHLQFLKDIQKTTVKTIIEEKVNKVIPSNTIYEDKVKDVSEKIIKESQEKAQKLYDNKLKEYKKHKQLIAKQAEEYLNEKTESIRQELYEQYIDFLSSNDKKVNNLVKSNIDDITLSIDENNKEILSKVDKLSNLNKEELAKILSENIININNNLDSKVKDLNDQLDIILHDSNTKLNKLDEKTSRLLEKNIKHTDEIVKNITSKIEQVDEKIEDYKIDTFKHVVEKVADNKTEIEASLKNTISKINEQVDIKRDEVEKILAAELSNINEKLNIFSEEEDKKYKQLLENLNNLNKGEVKEILSEKINDKQLNSLKLDISKQFQNEMMSIKRLIEMSSGGGSVAKQFANGGTMDGSLNVTQNILSGGRNLDEIFNTDTSITLQDVTDNGNTTTNSISTNNTIIADTILATNILSATNLDIGFELSGFNVTGSVSANGDITGDRVIAINTLSANGNLYPQTIAENGEVIVANGDGNLVFGHGEKLHLEVRNDEGSVIDAGTPVYSKGEIGGSERIKVGIADANDPTKMPAIGISETQLTTTGDTKDGFAIINGIYNENISGFTNLIEGENLYVASGGGLTNVKPIGVSNLIQNIGTVLKIGGGGSILQGMKVSSIDRTNDIPNLSAKAIFYGQGDYYVQQSLSAAILDSTGATIGSSSVFAGSISASGDISASGFITSNGITSNGDLDMNGNSIVNVASGSITFEDGASIGSSGTGNLSLSGNVGIGTPSPSAKLDVIGDASIDGILTLIDQGYDGLKTITANNNDLTFASVHGIFGYSIGLRGNRGSTLGMESAGSILDISAPSDITLTPGGVTDIQSNLTVSGNVGIGTNTPSAKLEVVGHFTATTKSFLVDKPNGGKLQYGVTESNEHSVFVRGKTDQETIKLPEEWEWLVDEDSVTVTVTPVGKFQPLYVISQSNNEVKVGGVEGEYNYIIYGTRKDVAPLEVNV